MFLLLLVVGDAAAQQKCDEAKLMRLERQLPAKPAEVARGLLAACPSPPPVLRLFLDGVGQAPQTAADRMLLDQTAADRILLSARDAYRQGRWEDAIQIAVITLNPACFVEEWLHAAGLSLGLAHALAKGVAPAPPRQPPIIPPRFRGQWGPCWPTPSPSVPRAPDLY